MKKIAALTGKIGIFTVTIETVESFPVGLHVIDIPLIDIRVLVTVTFLGFEILQFGLK